MAALTSSAISKACLRNAAFQKSQFAGRSLVAASKPVASAKANVTVMAAASERPLWFPGSDAPEWLDGSLPGDYGFDPLGLGSDPELLKWFVQAELQNARWAMLGAAGIFIPDLLTKIGILNVPFWFTAGAEKYQADGWTLFAVELALMGWAEGRRWADIVKPGSVNVDPVFPNNKLTGTDVGYPGGLWFDPLGFGSGDAAKVRKARAKELANGRLAMLAFVGAWFQAVYTGARPTENLFAHLSDPGHINIFSTLAN
jgi:light-harvesting complex I chlorophyll a/b binding protein 2